MHQHYGVPCSCKRKGVIGLVFVPGIMGSRLQNAESGEIAWDPAVGLGSHPTGWLEKQRELQTQYLQLKLRKTVAENSGVAAPNSAENIARRAREHLKQQPKLEYHDDEEIRKLEAGKQNWRKLRAVWHLAGLVLAGSDERKQLLVNSEPGATDRDDRYLEVDQGTDTYFKTFTSVKDQDIARRRRQGWGEVSWGSYGKFLRWLDSWVSSELEYQFHNWNFVTYAVGYNWMLSNDQSGERLKRRLGEIKQEISEEFSVATDNVKLIVISHSMGGYVSRAAAVMHDAEFDAVIHGAMPTHGSPAVYVNARCGYPFPAGLALGVNAAEVTAVVGFCQGALELLPNQHYMDKNGNKDWFKIQIEGQQPISMTNQYPGEKIFDFYKDTSNWYSLIQPELLRPEEPGPHYLPPFTKALKQRISSTKGFHKGLSNNFHFNTKLLYGNNDDFPSFDQCIWFSKQAPEGPPHTWQIFKDQNQRYSLGEGSLQLTDQQSMAQYRTQYNEAWRQSRFSDGHENVLLNRVATPPNSHFQLQPAGAPGDGTVHIGAGEHPNILKRRKFPLQLDHDHQLFFDSEEVMVKLSELLWEQTRLFDQESKGI